jgi:hypothetical protein
MLRRAMGNSNTQDSSRPELGGSHHLPSFNILCSSPRRPHSNGLLSRNSQMGVPKFPQLGLSQLWRHITWRGDLWLQCNVKQSCSPRWELSNGMSHVSCTQGNWVDSQLLVVGSQTTSLTPSLSFDHNLCFKCPNGQCEPILDIYTSIDFQWYKGIHLGVWGFIPSHSLHS